MGRLALFGAALVLCLLAFASQPTQAKNCLTRSPGTMMAWRHEQGTFQCNNCMGAEAGAVSSGATRRLWSEYDKSRQLLNTFVEELREGTQLVLRDEDRDISILLRSDLCGIRTGGEQNFRQLYGGTFVSIVDCT